jgi:protein-S-isoprenylcysteine O-methyltransferase Ste14
MQDKAVSVATCRVSGFYQFVRHPIQAAVLIGVKAIPTSTTSHLIFAAGISTYIFRDFF